MMKIGEIAVNEPLQAGYFLVKFFVPEIAAAAQAGQFVHVRIEEGSEHLLRRPFSIHDVDENGLLSVVYKVVGAGTRRLAELKPGAVCDLMGPLGRAYTPPAPDETPVLVAGGYGSAAMYLLAKRAAVPGRVLLGARTAADVILADRYEQTGFQLAVTTNDGSLGHPGFVTGLLPELMAELADRRVRLYGCGPYPMLLALATLMRERHWRGEVSLDHLMCCGIGACFACVVRVNADTPEGWRYARACKDGPVFDADEVYLGR